ncbi:MAG: hypothetical protein PHC39_04960 [Proteiniphilum sp.]|nr:hypothetical protein [Proteiniphilum sp.]
MQRNIAICMDLVEEKTSTSSTNFPKIILESLAKNVFVLLDQMVGKSISKQELAYVQNVIRGVSDETY